MKQLDPTVRSEELKDLEEILQSRVLGQERAIARMVNTLQVVRAGLTEPNRPIANLLLLGPSGVGKCLKKGTPILMFDGTIVRVEQLQVGDLLMGPDSKPRRVLSL